MRLAIVIIIVAFAFLASAGKTVKYASSAHQLWAGWKIKFGKGYVSPEEEIQRFRYFQENLARADAINSQPSETAHFGPTKFADMSAEEFKTQYLSSLKLDPTIPTAEEWKVVPEFEVQDIPDSFNWNDTGALTPIYNQRLCGGCWAFSTTEQIESMYFIKHRNDSSNPPTKPEQLSMQQIIDCDKGDGDKGCEGGDTRFASTYVRKAGGLMSYKKYPFTGLDGNCSFDSADVKADISGWSYVTSNTSKNETQMLYYVATTGPISICVDASTWQLYDKGVIRFFCGHHLDHAVQLAGYGVETDSHGATIEYWTIRNSWGIDWGENGFVRVERNKDLCGLADLAITVDAV